MQRNGLVLIAAVAATAIAALGYFSGRHVADVEAARDAQTRTQVEAKTGNSMPRGIAAAVTAKTQSRLVTQRMLTSAASDGSTTPLPAPGTPLKDSFAELKALADAGDGAAASRLFQDMQRCAEAQRASQFVNALANRALGGPMPNSPDGLQRGGRELDVMQHSLDLVQKNQALCADVTPDMMAALVPSTLQAAQAGDAQAADCYVGANLNTWPDVINNPDWISDYKQNALSLANSALRQGDWAMAALLASANSGSPRSNTLLNQVTGTNVAQAYTYARLLSLGQPTGTQPSQRSTNALSALSGQLTSDQIAAADAQAQQLYQQNFNATPRQTGQIANSTRACQQTPF